jgi:large subunit ribosomal protein L24
MYIKTGDLVEIIAGKDKGRTGRVVRVDLRRERVVVEGVNLVTRNQKPNQISEGGRFSKAAPLHVSNVRLYSEDDGRGFRIGYRYEGQDGSLYGSNEEARQTFADAPSRISKIRVFLKKGGEIARVPEAVRGDDA